VSIALSASSSSRYTSKLRTCGGHGGEWLVVGLPYALAAASGAAVPKCSQSPGPPQSLLTALFRPLTSLDSFLVSSTKKSTSILSQGVLYLQGRKGCR
jgi:hypothetical protein